MGQTQTERVHLRSSITQIADVYSAHTERESGAALIFVGLMMIMIIGFGAFVLDIGRAYLAKAELQAAVDAAVLAAAGDLPDAVAVEATALLYANANDYGWGPILDPGDVDMGFWEAATETFYPNTGPFNAVQITAKRVNAQGNPVETVLARVLGFDEFNITGTAVASREVVADVVIVQDITGSFEDELPIAIDADKGLIDTFAASHAQGVHLGVVTFARTGDEIAPLESLLTSQASSKAALDAVVGCSPSGNSPGDPCYGTDMSVGLDRAVNMLVNDGRPGIEDVIVLVSDGVPCIAELPMPAKIQTGKDWATASANAADAAGVSIFVITLDQESTSSSPCLSADVSFNESLARGFGWGTTTTDPLQLEALLASIVGEMPVQLVN